MDPVRRIVTRRPTRIPRIHRLRINPTLLVQFILRLGACRCSCQSIRFCNMPEATGHDQSARLRRIFLFRCSLASCVGHTKACLTVIMRASISSWLYPSISARTSVVCWPSVGGAVRILGLVSENLTGGLMSFIGPQDGCSTSVTMPRARTEIRQL